MKTMKHLSLLVLVSLLALTACSSGSSSSDDEVVADGLGEIAPDGIDEVDPGDIAKDGDAGDIADATDADAAEAGDSLSDIDEEALALFIDQGKYWLVNAEPYFALEAFESALELAPEAPDALFGAALAQQVYGSERFLTYLQMAPGQLFGFPAPVEEQTGFLSTALQASLGALPRSAFSLLSALDALPDGIAPQLSENDFLAQELRELLGFFHGDFAIVDARLDALLALPPEVFELESFEWSIEGVPFYVAVRPLMRFSGTYRKADLLLMRVTNDTMLWMLDFLLGQDFRGDVMTVIAFARGLSSGGVEIWELLNLMGYLLSESPHFLALHDEEGKAYADDAHARMISIGENLVAALTHIREVEDRANGVTALNDSAPSDTITIANRVLRGDTDNPEELPMSMLFPGAVQESYDAIIEALGSPGAAMPFDEGAVVQLSTLVIAFSKSGLLEVFASDALPIDISPLELNSAVLLFNNLLKSAMAFDWASFHEHPVGLRFVLPLIGYDEDTADAGSFLLEWECSAEVEASGIGQPAGSGGFLCTADAVFEDSAHFVGTPYEIPADGVVSRLPYMAWEDPTWGGLLYVDPSLIPEAINIEEGYAPATNHSLNLALGGMIGPILDMFL